MKYYQSWIGFSEPKPQHYLTLIILTENGTKASQHPEESSECPSELFLKVTFKLQEITRNFD